VSPHVINATVDNILMVVSTPTTITLLASNNPKLRRWSGLTGMFGQIFWITSNCTWERWGMCVVSSYMALIYVRSFFTYWLLPHKHEFYDKWMQHIHAPHISIHFRHGSH
jgi:hypothetical protein